MNYWIAKTWMPSSSQPVITGTHAITKEALKKGKAVYCEKPMVHKISEGLDVVDAHKASRKVMQVGSQRVSSIVYAKAQEL